MAVFSTHLYGRIFLNTPIPPEVIDLVRLVIYPSLK